MKKILSVTLLFILLSCNQSETNVLINEDELNKMFLNPKTNTVFDEHNNILFNSNSFRDVEIEYLKDKKLSSILNSKFNKIRGFTIYYQNAEPEKIDKQILQDEIFALSIYEFNYNNEIVHKFYLKENNSFVNKFCLLENTMNTSNQIFLVSLYKQEMFRQNPIGIYNFSDVNEVFSEKNKNQRNEFELFKVVTKHKMLDYARKNSTVFRAAEPVFCVACAESAGSICDAGVYCSNETPMCEKDEEEQDISMRGLLSSTNADILFNDELYYNLRDNLMLQYNIGEKYIDYYYAISSFVQKSDYDVSTLIKMISTLPDLNNSIEKLLSNTNNNEIIITEQLKLDILSIINDLRTVSNNEDFQTILNELESDIIFLSNKTKTNLINDLQ